MKQLVLSAVSAIRIGLPMLLLVRLSLRSKKTAAPRRNISQSETGAAASALAQELDLLELEKDSNQSAQADGADPAGVLSAEQMSNSRRTR